jgi:hypothetical protein
MVVGGGQEDRVDGAIEVESEVAVDRVGNGCNDGADLGLVLGVFGVDFGDAPGVVTRAAG